VIQIQKNVYRCLSPPHSFSFLQHMQNVDLRVKVCMPF
jgi:hypothetical protein